MHIFSQMEKQQVVSWITNYDTVVIGTAIGYFGEKSFL